MKTVARVFTVEELNDICAIYKEEIAGLKERVRNLESWHKDPRVFTVEEVKPLLFALKDVQNCHRQDDNGLDLYWVGETSFMLVREALAHARKLGMVEDKQ